MNSIFGIGVLEFIFILIFALIFLGPERLPKVTKDVLFFIRRLQRLSGDLTRQVNEEIGDLRELDPSYHMKQLMDDEEEEEEKSIGQGSGQKSTTETKQTSAPSQPAQAADAAAASSSQEAAEEKSSPQPALSDLNAAASANGRQQSGGSSDSNLKTTGTAIPSAPKASSAKVTTRSTSAGATPRRTGSTQKRGVKTLSELRKQQRAKRQSSSSGADSSYLDERNKRAQRRAENRRQAVAAQKNEREEASETEDTASDPIDARASNESTVVAEMSSNGEGSGKSASDSDALAKDGSTESDEGVVAAVTEDADGEGDEEAHL